MTEKHYQNLMNFTFILFLCMLIFILSIFCILNFTITKSNNTELRFIKNYYNNYNSNIKYILEDDILLLNNISYCNKVTGNSMSPTIMHNQIICLENYTTQTLLPGMIVRIETEEITFVHRIIAIYSDVIITQGDNNRFDDGRINISNITHIVRSIII